MLGKPFCYLASHCKHFQRITLLLMQKLCEVKLTQKIIFKNIKLALFTERFRKIETG